MLVPNLGVLRRGGLSRDQLRSRQRSRAVNPSAVLLFGRLAELLSAPERLSQIIENNRTVPLSLLRRSACLLQSAKAIREPRKINKNMVCCLRSRI